MKGGYVYIMTNRKNGTLYRGVTADLCAPCHQHRNGRGATFSQRYGLTRLVYWAHFDEIERAIQREKTMKRWPRQWKLNAITALNPDWRDLYDEINA